MAILWIVLGIIVLLLLVALTRALTMKPTLAKTAKVDTTVTEKAKIYGEKLRQMIRVETISEANNTSTEKFYRLHDVMKELFPTLYANAEVVDIDANLLFKWKGKTSKDPVLLMSHQDVVEATGKWQHDAFSGEIIDEKVVWGRGTVDTKANLFCMMQAFEELMKEGYTPEVDMYIASSVTEEVGGDGAPKLVNYLKEQGVKLRFLLDEGGLVMEEPLTGLTGTYAMVGVLEKGNGNLRFIAKSNGGHASAPSKNTPLVRLGKFMAEVEKNYPLTSQLNGTVEEMFRRVAPNMSFSNRLLLGNLWLFKPLVVKILTNLSPTTAAMMRTSIAFTRAEGSDGYNVIPQTAWVSANIRYIPHQDKEESNRILSDLAKKFDIETQVIDGSPSCPVVSHESQGFRLLEETMAEVYPGVGVTPYAMTGATDARFYSEICENALRFGPLYINRQQLESIHGLDENIDMKALDYGVKFFKKFVKKVPVAK